MPNPYSIELRDRAVRAYETTNGGYTVVAKQFGVDRATLIRWVQRSRRTGSAAAHPKRGGWTSPVDVELLERLIQGRPDMTTEELTRAYNREAARPRRVHRSSVLRALHRRQFVFKKTLAPDGTRSSRCPSQAVHVPTVGHPDRSRASGFCR